MKKQARIYNGKRQTFNKLYWENRYHVQKLAHCFTLYRKINSTWIKDLNVRPETMKLLEKHISRHLLDISPAIYIYRLWLQINETMSNKKAFCTVKKTINKSKRQHLEGRTYLQIISNKGLIEVKVYKELVQPNNSKNNNRNLTLKMVRGSE